jgi:alkyl hydroperoxide reductase subunit AhpC
VLLYNKYKSKGFEIFGVSLDDDREAWIEAINKDKLLWMHGSDLQKWNSSLVGTYGIDAIPYTVLVDKDGKIIAKKLRGKELENKLKELFGF